MSAPETPAYESQLPDGWQRFLAHVVEHGLQIGRRTPDDFIRHFPPSAIMAGLEDEPQRRADILVVCTGVKLKIAIKKSAASCAQDLQIALDEEETDAAAIVALLTPDERVLHLDAKKLWAYATEGEFWKDASPTARGHVAFVIRRALDDELLTHREVVEGIGTAMLAERLPREELAKVLAATLKESHAGASFDEKKLLDVVPATILVESIPLAILWDRVVVPKIAERHALIAGTRSAPPPAAAPPEPVAAPPSADAAAEEPPKTKAKSKTKPAKPEGEDLDLAIDDVLGFDED